MQHRDQLSDQMRVYVEGRFKQLLLDKAWLMAELRALKAMRNLYFWAAISGWGCVLALVLRGGI